ncbi:hypothetical protein [Desulforhopalus sp. 52FAK]
MTFKEKIPIGGIKFSEERIHYAVSCLGDTQATIKNFLQHIHNKQINIPFLAHTSFGDSTKTCFCVSKKDAPLITKIIESSPDIPLDITTQQQVTSVTIFPHKKDLTFVAIIMSLLESLQLPVYSSCTSISAYVFNTESDALQTIASEFTDIFSLPENHSPFHQEFKLHQPRTPIAP